MPIPPTIANQLTPSGIKPYSNQQNFGQVIGEASSWVPHAGISMIQNWINNAVRKYYGRRNWYGLMTKGQIVTPGYYSAGNVSLINGSSSVHGTGTAWGQSLVGQQLRVGFTSPIYTILAVDQVNQVLTLELPWGTQTQLSSGYFISQYYYSFPNIKYFYSVKNLQLMYRMWTNFPQAFIENVDPARLQMVYPRMVATMPPDVNGNYQVELWPVPNTQMALPYIAYIQPPNLVDDADNFPAYMRCDIITNHVIAEGLLYKPKINPNYSESTCITISAAKMKEFERELAQAETADENLYRQDIVTWAEQFPYIDVLNGTIPGGAMLAAMSPVGADDY